MVLGGAGGVKSFSVGICDGIASSVHSSSNFNWFESDEKSLSGYNRTLCVGWTYRGTALTL